MKESRDREAESRLQLALDAGAIVGTWVWEVRSNCFTADERFARSFGLPAERCRAGLTLDEVITSIHPDDQVRVNEAISGALACGGPYRCEYRVRHQDRGFRWVEARGRVDLDSDGQPERFPGIVLDIEARRGAEAERDRMSELLRTFAAAVPGVVYAKDRAGRMLVANHGATRLIGKPREFYLGKTDLEFLDDKAQARVVMATDQRIMESGEAEQIEEDVRLPDGTEATWLSTKSPLRNAQGEIVGLIGSSIDVTARKRAEASVKQLNATLEQKIRSALEEQELAQAALRQSQKMDAVGQLTGGIAHDFNNLLMGISGSLEVLQTRVSEGRISEIGRYVNAAQGAAKRAAALTHRLLAFSRRQTLDPQSADVNRLIRDMAELVRRTVGPQILIEIVGAVGLWPTRVDQNQLENALLNLCINSRDAMPAGGRITIETANKWLDERAAAERDLPAGQYISLCVTDTGAGMSPEVMRRAFDPFFTTKPLGQGTGLGLSMIYGFVRQSGGQVRMSSEVGIGTTVCLYLPRDPNLGEESGRTSTSSASPPTARGAGEVVLIVDDEPTIRALVTEVLADFGYASLEAGDGVTGLKLIQSGARIDLLITDVGLPGGVNGRQLADAARVLLPKLKVLFITGYAENAVFGNGHLDPGMQILTKPFSMEILATRIKTMIES